ncbi:MAG: hypothetical protein ACRD4U_08270 [Candidatus Acidiferrales bacterium]
MKPILVPAVLATLCCSLAWLASGASAQSAPTAEGAGWTAKILETAQPDTVTLVRTKVRQQYPMIDKTETTERAPAGQKWLVLVMEFQLKTGLKVSDLRILEGSSKGAPPVGIGVHKQPWKFDVVKDFPKGMMSTGESLQWYKTGRDLMFTQQMTEPGWAALLFSVPAAATEVQLQVERASPLSVPLGESKAGSSGR